MSGRSRVGPLDLNSHNKRFIENGAVVQLVRTPACQAGGREFKSRQSRFLNPRFLIKKSGVFIGFFVCAMMGQMCRIKTVSLS